VGKRGLRALGRVRAAVAGPAAPGGPVHEGGRQGPCGHMVRLADNLHDHGPSDWPRTRHASLRPCVRFVVKRSGHVDIPDQTWKNHPRTSPDAAFARSTAASGAACLNTEAAKAGGPRFRADWLKEGHESVEVVNAIVRCLHDNRRRLTRRRGDWRVHSGCGRNERRRGRFEYFKTLVEVGKVGRRAGQAGLPFRHYRVWLRPAW